MDIFSTQIGDKLIFLRKIDDGNDTKFSFFSPKKGIEYGPTFKKKDLNPDFLQKKWYPLDKTSPEHFLSEICAHCSDFSSQIEFIGVKGFFGKKKFKIEIEEEPESELEITPTQLKSQPSYPTSPMIKQLRIKPSQTKTQEKGMMEGEATQELESTKLNRERREFLKEIGIDPDEPLLEESQELESIDPMESQRGSLSLSTTIDEIVFDPHISNLVLAEIESSRFINELFESFVRGKGDLLILHDTKFFRDLKKQYLSDKFVLYTYFINNERYRHSEIQIEESEVINLTIVISELGPKITGLLLDDKKILEPFHNLKRIKLVFSKEELGKKELVLSKEDERSFMEKLSRVVDNILAHRFFETVIIENETFGYLNMERDVNLWDCTTLFCSSYFGVLPFHVEKLILKSNSAIIDRHKTLRIIHYYGKVDLLSRIILEMISEIKTTSTLSTNVLERLENLTILNVEQEIDILQLPQSIVSVDVQRLKNSSRRDPNKVCPGSLRFVKVNKIEQNADHVPKWIESYSINVIEPMDDVQIKRTLSSFKRLKTLQFGQGNVNQLTHIENVIFPKTCFCIDLGKNVFDYMGITLPLSLVKLEVTITDESEIEEIKGALIRIFKEEKSIRLKELLIKTVVSKELNLIFIRGLFVNFPLSFDAIIIDLSTGEKLNILTSEEEEGNENKLRTWKRKIISQTEGEEEEEYIGKDIQDIDSRFSNLNPFKKKLSINVEFDFTVALADWQSQQEISFTLQVVSSVYEPNELLAKPYKQIVHQWRQLLLKPKMDEIRQGKKYGLFRHEFILTKPLPLPQSSVLKLIISLSGKPPLFSGVVAHGSLKLDHIVSNMIPRNYNETRNSIYAGDVRPQGSSKVIGSFRIKVLNTDVVKTFTFSGK